MKADLVHFDIGDSLNFNLNFQLNFIDAPADVDVDELKEATTLFIKLFVEKMYVQRISK